MRLEWGRSGRTENRMGLSDLLLFHKPHISVPHISEEESWQMEWLLFLVLEMLGSYLSFFLFPLGHQSSGWLLSHREGVETEKEKTAQNHSFLQCDRGWLHPVRASTLYRRGLLLTHWGSFKTYRIAYRRQRKHQSRTSASGLLRMGLVTDAHKSCSAAVPFTWLSKWLFLFSFWYF